MQVGSTSTAGHSGRGLIRVTVTVDAGELGHVHDVDLQTAQQNPIIIHNIQLDTEHFGPL